MFSTFRTTAIGAAALALVAGFAAPAQAGYVVTLEQVGPNVVATGSGPIDLTGLSPPGSSVADPEITPALGFIDTGPTSSPSINVYAGLTGPASFGSGSNTLASSGSGNLVGERGGDLAVPAGYVSGSALSDTATYNNATFSSLGVLPGTYEWKWGTGVNQNFTLIIGAATTPEPASLTLLALGLAGLGMVLRTRRV